MASTSSRISSRGWVTGMLATALGAVGLLTFQAAGAPHSAHGPGAGHGAGAARHGTALPAGSGSGKRVVYSLSGERVWLVGRDGEVVRTFPVTGGSLRPSTGGHKVFARRMGGRGGDGAKVEHVVLFARTGKVNIGFSAAAGDPAPVPAARRGGAIREDRADAAALWRQAVLGSAVVVVE